MKKILALVLSIVMLFSLCVPAYAGLFGKDEGVLRLVVPENWEMTIGDSRSVDLVADNTSNYATWSVDPADVASVDAYGRVTALKEGKAVVTAQNAAGLTDSVELTVVKESTKLDGGKTKVDYQGASVAEVANLQKIVTRYALDSKKVPDNVKDNSKYAEAQTATTSDGAVWTITAYGVLRTDKNAPTERDIEQRFMGDRYFYSNDTTDGKVLAIFADGEKGIWTAMAEGYTHIEMKEINGTDKAAMMSETTQQYVSRRGMVSEAYLINGEWVPNESDNDGLWTSMYGAGELMRYAVLKDDPDATPEEIEAARKTATLSAEAVVMLTYISMRQGTTESYVRAQRSGSVTDPETGKYYTNEALVEGGNYAQAVPYDSPAKMFDNMYKKYMRFGVQSYVQKDGHLAVTDANSWVNTTDADESIVFAKRTRLLEGFWARTYSFKDEKFDYDGYAYWSHNGDGTATGKSTKKYSDGSDFLLHNENYRGLKIDASGEIPERLWNDLIGSGYDVEDIFYKGDTSSDEIIGHLFIYKLAYDILAEEDPELGELIVNAVEKFAQHIVDNSYCLVDGSGQPTTWGKFSRTYLHNGQVLGGAPLQTSVLLCLFKLAGYLTGDQKWENEYRMAALDEQYQYAEIMTQNRERYNMAILEFANSVSEALGFILRPLVGTKTFNAIYRLILNYSDEEMAMLAYYLLFQMEDDEELLGYFRDGLEGWWYSMSFSENPLWYYIYQLAYPNETKTDYYGNSLVETAAWALSRHPIDTRRYGASNSKRDDIKEIDLDDFGIDGTGELSYSLDGYKPLFRNSDNDILQIIGLVLGLNNFKWAVAPFDERSMHKYNGSTYEMDNNYNPNEMEGSTTYTLPYWMGRYHGMLG